MPTASSARAISAIDWNRYSRSFCSALRMIASASTGIAPGPTSALGACGASNMCLVRMPMNVSAVNGTRPVSSSYMMTPTAYTSTR